MVAEYFGPSGSTPQDVRDPARADIVLRPSLQALADAALRLELQELQLKLQHVVMDVQIARHHLKHERLMMADKVLAAAVEQAK
jgi:hypothetical protein